MKSTNRLFIGSAIVILPGRYRYETSKTMALQDADLGIWTPKNSYNALYV